jgi:hypothetical protein
MGKESKFGMVNGAWCNKNKKMSFTQNVNPVFNDPQFNRNEEFHYV